MTFVVDNYRAKFLLAPASAFVVKAPFNRLSNKVVGNDVACRAEWSKAFKCQKVNKCLNPRKQI